MFFERQDSITPDDVLISANFVYGWMPTMLKNVDFLNLERIANILTLVKKGKILDVNELNLVRSITNNSIVSVSKLLHLVEPNNYAIWDSRVYRYIYQTDKYAYNNTIYMSYLEKCRHFSRLSEFGEFFDLVSAQFPFAVSHMRALDVVMFTGGSRSS